MIKNKPTYLIKKLLGIACCFLFSSISNSILAQTPLSLDSCLHMAAWHNKVIRQAHLEVDKAQQTKIKPYPTIFRKLADMPWGIMPYNLF